MNNPIALTIAGSDSAGGAGIQADLKTFSALGVYGASVLTALTAQNTLGVRDIHDVPATFIQSQLEAVFDDLAVAAVKIGMLSQPETIYTLARVLRQYELKHIVLDPVMVAKGGDKLLADEAVDALRSELLPIASVLTPNLPEAAVLVHSSTELNKSDMLATAQSLLELGPKAILIKGGRLANNDSSDLLINRDTELWLPEHRIDTQNTHGTGCTLSSAIAAGLAKGLELVDAVSQAKSYLTVAISAADKLDIGQGHGPVHHFHRWW